MRKTLEVLNRLVDEKIILGYAIGGAMGAMWYMEAIATMDLDVFVLFVDEKSLDPLSSIYGRLKGLGYEVDPQQKECINIEGVPVQFLPVYNELLKAAMEAVEDFVYEGTPVCVLSAEYLAAICVQTGRMKDKLRVEMFLQSEKFDKARFQHILSQFNLKDKYLQWKLV